MDQTGNDNTFQFLCIGGAGADIFQTVDIVVEKTFALEDIIQVDVVVFSFVTFGFEGKYSAAQQQHPTNLTRHSRRGFSVCLINRTEGLYDSPVDFIVSNYVGNDFLRENLHFVIIINLVHRS